MRSGLPLACCLLGTLLASPPARAIPRDDVIGHAAAFAIHRWTATEANRTAECSDSYVSGYGPGTWVGLPYDWGGYVTLEEFDAQIADGYGAGSHSWHGILACTTGLDCSGFVSKCWETTHQSTRTLHSVSRDIAWEDLLRGDAVNDAGSHVVLYTHTSAGGQPIYYEAAGTPDKVRINTTGGWSYLDGYVPVRFDGIEEGPSSTGTVAAPIEVTTFPYEDLRSTAGAPSRSFDAYACAPDLPEGGPEVVYRVTLPASGRLQARVSDAAENDVDLHVLSAPRADACLARADAEIDLAVEAGTVWLVADTWVSSGSERPGPYLLTVDFTAGGVPDTGTDEGDSGGLTFGDSGTDDEDGLGFGDSGAPPGARKVGGGCASAPGSGAAGGVLVAAVLAVMAGRRRGRG
jgi:hypothetical protein